MKRQTKDKILFSIKNGTIFGEIRKWIGLHSIINLTLYHDLKALSYEDMMYRKLKRKMKNVVIEPKKQLDAPKVVWFCWLQGIEEAPDLIKKCYNTLSEKMAINGYEVKVVTSDNFKQYVTLPDFIVNKWKKGIINNTAFSDILRIALLSEVGGTWIDSTVLATFDKFPKYIFDEELFYFSHKYRNSRAIIASSWFIHSKKTHNKIIDLTYMMLIEYWKHKNYIEYYLLVHVLFNIACERYPEIEKKVPFYSNMNPHVLQHEMYDEFSDKRWQQIKKMSDFHKLSRHDIYEREYKTFYDFVINDL